MVIINVMEQRTDTFFEKYFTISSCGMIENCIIAWTLPTIKQGRRKISHAIETINHRIN